MKGPTYQRTARASGCSRSVKRASGFAYAAAGLLAATLAGACAKTDRDAPHYYYPVEALTGGLVYGYAPVEPLGGAPHYWYHRGVETADSTMLVSTYYAADFEPRQLVRERIVREGSLLRDLRLYFPTASGESQTVRAEVLQPALFSFGAPDADRLLVSSVAFSEPAAGGTEGAAADGVTGFGESENQDPRSRPRYTLTRNRSYVSDTLYVLDGATVDAQLWHVRELTEQDSAGVLTIESRAIEIYARDIGLVYRERRFANGEGEGYRLAERITMDSLNARAAAALAAASAR